MIDKLGNRLKNIPPADAKRMYLIELSKIQLNPDQPRKRIDEEKLKELAASIKKHGQLQPAVLKRTEDPETYVLAAGERRYRALQSLGETSIYAVVTDGDLDEIALIENVQREDLHPLELAESFQRLINKHKWNQGELGEAIGKTRIAINETLRLNVLPEDIKAECRALDTPISKIALLQIARIEDPEQQREFWDRVKTGDFTTRQLQTHRKERTTPKEAPKGGIQQAISSGRAFTNKLRGLTAKDVGEEDYYTLIEIKEGITNILDEIYAQRGH